MNPPLLQKVKDLLPNRQSCACLAGLVCCVTLTLAGEIAGISYAQEVIQAKGQPSDLASWLYLFLGVGIGHVVSSLQTHSRRSLGLIPYASLGLVVALGASVISRDGYLISALLGVAGGIAFRSLLAADTDAIRCKIDARPEILLFVIALCLIGFVTLGVLMVDRAQVVSPRIELLIVFALAVIACIVSWWLLLREAIEFFIEILLWPMYRLKAYGPGRSSEHHQGPLIVVSNHTAWLDPLWLAKFVDRSVTPMMTSKYYDVPILRWLIAKVAHAIRVQAGTFRRDVPELREAVEVLDRKGCLVIFPEGFMRRSDDRPLRNFGQGVWRILRERPATRVLICWIEGGWGSFTSYRGGLPMRNKPLDWRRPINVAMELPLVLEPGLLEDQRATRHFLMQKCLRARALLGLEPFELDVTADEEPEKDTVASSE